MQIDLQARGFVLTPALSDAVHRAAQELDSLLGERLLRIQVRLFDTNSTKGGIDKGCLITARIGRLRRISVASSIDADLYRAINTAFDKVARTVLAAAGRHQSARRRRRPAAFADGHAS